MKFSKHVDDINTIVRRKLSVLKAISGVDCGRAKEDLIYLFKQYIRPHFSYASNAWRPNASKTSLKKLQTTQNMALRAATGLTKMTSIDTIHREAKVLKVEQHLDMIGAQAATKYANPLHPLHKLLDAPKPPRLMKQTPAHFYNKFIPQDDTLTVPQKLKRIHTNITRDSIAALERSKLTDSVPPDINEEEKSLPRKLRIDLARLRSGWHPRLENYLHRINKLRTPECRRCHRGTGDVHHFLLQCPSLVAHRRTANIRSVYDLWTNPVAVGDYVQLANL